MIEEKESKEEDFYEDLDRFEENGTQESRISPYTFCKAFPFHIIFDRDLVVTQCGNAIYRVLPQVKDVTFPGSLRSKATEMLLFHVATRSVNLCLSVRELGALVTSQNSCNCKLSMFEHTATLPRTAAFFFFFSFLITRAMGEFCRNSGLVFMRK